MVVTAELHGVKFMGLNGGPQFTPNSSVSFMVIAENEEEVNRYWKALSVEGIVLMDLDTYPWSPKYGWVKDKFGIDWQIYQGDPAGTGGQYIVPTLMFGHTQQGQAAPAIDFYLKLFKNSESQGLMRYTEGWADQQVMHAQFKLENLVMAAMDSGVPQPITFNEGVSFVIECDDQAEIDHYWDNITERGVESMCGWCQDEFGVWWQVIPESLGTLINDPERGQYVASELMKMKKIDLEKLERAGDQ